MGIRMFLLVVFDDLPFYGEDDSLASVVGKFTIWSRLLAILTR